MNAHGIACASAVAAGLLCALATPAAAEQPVDHVIAYSDKAMGTIVRVSLWGDNEAAAARASRAVFDEFQRIDALMSSWKPGSDVTKINEAAGGAPVVVSQETIDVIERALAMSKKSRGAFDITVGAFRGLWKFDQDRDGTLPSAAAVAERTKLVNYRDVIVNAKKRTVKLRRKGQRITLGGVAKGHAVDRAVALLYKHNFVDFILQAGGDLYVGGRRGPRNWRVGIRDPRGARDSTFAITAIADQTFSTSGDYERSVVKNGVRYHHILDPKSGQPARGARSVTVMAKDALTADMWSTALFVMGPKKGLALAERHKDIEAVFVDKDNKVVTTKGLAAMARKEFENKRPRPATLRGILLILRPPSAGI